MFRTPRYVVGAFVAVTFATAVAYAPPEIASPARIAKIEQRASNIAPQQLESHIARVQPATNTPLPLTITSTPAALQPATLPGIAPNALTDTLALEDDALTSTLALTATLADTAALSPTVAPEDAPLQIAELGGRGPTMRGQIVVRTEQLDFYVGRSSLSPEQINQLAPRVEVAFRLAENRFGEQIYHRVSLGYYYPTQRNLRGLAFTDQARAELYYRPGESLDRALAPAVHELAHHLQEQRYGHAIQSRADTILLEGAATWIAGDSWLPMCGAANWKERARQIRNAGVPLELTRAERYGANNAYELWASFVDFILEDYGPKTYRALYTTSRGRAHGSANYQGVTGKSLDALTQEWRAWIDR